MLDLSVGSMALIRELPESWEGHYYKQGDLVRVIRCKSGLFEVLVLRANRKLHFLLSDHHLQPLSPLQTLAAVDLLDGVDR